MVPPSAIKYRNEAYNYYASFNKDIEKLLKVGSEAQLAAAKAKADAAIAELPIFLFKKIGPKVIARDPNL